MAQRILKVPNVKQKENHCGPACLSMILGFIGINISQEDIVDAMQLDPGEVSREGVRDEDLVFAAESLGFKGDIYYNLSLWDIRKFIDNGLPMIAPCRSDRWAGHYFVVKGYETNPRERVFVNDPADLRRRKFPYQQFNNDWDWNKKTGVIISQKRKKLPML